jgi:tRNA threonylcarbamoyladenosine biosynthesis protein TsaE
MESSRSLGMAIFISHNPQETEALGESWGKSAQPGWIFGLSGGLGAGKTQLVKGLARGLGVHRRVVSPTFALVHEYPGGRLPLAHLDLYRLETPSQVIGAGLEAYLPYPGGVTVVEWPERWPDLQRSCPSAKLRSVAFELLSESERRITYEDSGA